MDCTNQKARKLHVLEMSGVEGEGVYFLKSDDKGSSMARNGFLYVLAHNQRIGEWCNGQASKREEKKFLRRTVQKLQDEADFCLSLTLGYFTRSLLLLALPSLGVFVSTNQILGISPTFTLKFTLYAQGCTKVLLNRFKRRATFKYLKEASKA